MPQTPYFVRTVNLANPILLGGTGSRLAAEGEPVTDVGIITLPGGAVGQLFLHIGQKGDGIPVNLQGQNFHLAQAETTGIWVSCPVSPGNLDVVFLVGLESELVPMA